MSAFASLGRQPNIQDYCYPHPVEQLLAGPVEASSFKFSIDNSVFTPSSVFLGLHPSEYIVARGLYQLKVHRGLCIINNAHQLLCGKLYPIVTSSAESLPTIAVPNDTEPLFEGPEIDPIFPKHATVIELSNWAVGIDNLGFYMPRLAKLYKRLELGHTFEFVQKGEDACSTNYFDEKTLRVLDSACRQMERVVVFGVPNSGKRTFCKALMNSTMVYGKRPVAYLDLDPSSIDGNNPGCLSLRVLRKPVFGEFFFWGEDDLTEDHTHRYYGFSSFTDKPELYLRSCDELLQHYATNLEPKGIPLVVRFPSWIKGYGKELLMEFSRTLKPKKMVYLTHNDALSLDKFEPDAFEETDHPDYDVLSGFHIKDTTIVRGVRRARAFTKQELLLRNKLLYFHQTTRRDFDFVRPLLHIAPVKFSFDHVSAISVLNIEADEDISKQDAFSLIEATIVGIFTVKNLPSVPKNFYLSGSKLTGLDYSYVGLCMVHLVENRERTFNIHLRDEDYVSEKIIHAKQNGHSVVLARGEGEIPPVEFTNGLSGEFSNVPYVSTDQMQKLGGIWKIRRNIGRKNQG
ncbi:hypothetical protein METBIDRAFT_30806 [Metschnikowia bicuspidata var. bicuspidata NRRL YB-4993]|uniref:Polynucleotide 5'-hydroxyl-kinase GRC3 n=1 Tax=Metschnikowia bicuspidata var. bicuspidata NRRL YB-4993 TaxID=869754 RepID=A0A1A0HCE1_9ASCO|nr:hypothetical protein METBIDRAFT_30806 [Metschnikowia bicuspidata var. bicuspidata NRRL YB-4993]OBA21779.1 hypothetical protein METBIDRAFT_30806 [Metschnikowia bicuspidata var. bicuspidata NRRL YB-4993]